MQLQAIQEPVLSGEVLGTALCAVGWMNLKLYDLCLSDKEIAGGLITLDFSDETGEELLTTSITLSSIGAGLLMTTAWFDNTLAGVLASALAWITVLMPGMRAVKTLRMVRTSSKDDKTEEP